MASGNCIAPPKLGNDRIAAEDALAEAWHSKFDQAYAKAEHLFGDSDEFTLLIDLKAGIQRRTIISRLRAWGPWIAYGLIMAALFGFLGIMSACSGE